MADAQTEYNKLRAALAAGEDVGEGRLFGSACITVHGQAFVARHAEHVVFKLNGAYLEKALAVAGAALWDPSGLGQPMPEWVAVPLSASDQFVALAGAAAGYAGTGRRCADAPGGA
ncbi:hypothetical protein HSX11_15125 [Oxalobacteraceae bacterium]|nr:hypothetical protein [Oxalobacteraceae bacterium]